MFGASPLESAGAVPFADGRMLSKLLRLVVALVCLTPLVSHAGSLVSLKSTVLSAETAPARATPAATFTLKGQPAPLGDLHGLTVPGLDPTLTPIAAATLEGD